MLCAIKIISYRYSCTEASTLLRGRPLNMAIRKITTERIPGPPKLPREEQEAVSYTHLDVYKRQR